VCVRVCVCACLCVFFSVSLSMLGVACMHVLGFLHSRMLFFRPLPSGYVDSRFHARMVMRACKPLHYMCRKHWDAEIHRQPSYVCHHRSRSQQRLAERVSLHRMPMKSCTRRQAPLKLALNRQTKKSFLSGGAALELGSIIIEPKPI